jgi:hypothetical protein
MAFACAASLPSKSDRGWILSLSPEHGIRYAFGVSLRRRLYLLLTPRRCGNCIIRRTIRDAIECVGNARQLESKLIGSARPFQHDDAFSAEVQSREEQESSHDGYEHHQHVVTGDGEASACDANYVVREQSFPPM